MSAQDRPKTIFLGTSDSGSVGPGTPQKEIVTPVVAPLASRQRFFLSPHQVRHIVLENLSFVCPVSVTSISSVSSVSSVPEGRNKLPDIIRKMESEKQNIETIKKFFFFSLHSVFFFFFRVSVDASFNGRHLSCCELGS